MKFRRSRSDLPDTETPDLAEPAIEPATAEVAGPRSNGPWDIGEVDFEEDDPSKLDLGSLVVTPREGLDLQLQVDEQSGHVVAVVLAGPEGALELRAFAAPRHGDIWDDVRHQIAAEVTRRGGTASEVEGHFGPELRVVLTMTTQDGRTAQQPSRVFGIAGPRWLLRATLFGKPALEPDESGLVESAMREVIVRRGSEPHAPGEALPLTAPPAVAAQMQAAHKKAQKPVQKPSGRPAQKPAARQPQRRTLES